MVHSLPSVGTTPDNDFSTECSGVGGQRSIFEFTTAGTSGNVILVIRVLGTRHI
ncbi:hypothetical protein D2E51_19750 [Mycobacteroides abscessus]|uniref:Uncharacterized protein n=8 Tax=Mycobacteroides abscessus TaxID=36809 RepID=B1MM62_MYCA9|nr:hypothetical protein MYCMA_02980 [Mycobacteroides abscessus subsp. massiliense str. GO 06]AWG57525.1 hypothetical protein DDT53_22235 [Mycobacteroides abscessus]QCO28439.1 hypothetical protein CFE69_00605 [Mycobacteroides abscessus subsp. massiliense]RTZ47207.1 hypothetical protein CJN95_017595 [Mycobacteroides abscessus subsp. abscessus]TKV40039.1 hypothetical protein CFA71_10885 [Mycobacteroides abscessus subsp. bolletii]CAM64847.1 Hypothetical protein MAB_4779 [Mycobacteroides abscessus 